MFPKSVTGAHCTGCCARYDRWSAQKPDTAKLQTFSAEPLVSLLPCPQKPTFATIGFIMLLLGSLDLMINRTEHR